MPEKHQFLNGELPSELRWSKVQRL